MSQLINEVRNALQKKRSIFFHTEQNCQYVLDYFCENLNEDDIRFDGEVPGVFYKVNYVQPYKSHKEIEEIKNIIRLTNAYKRFRSDFCGLVMLDITEWIGHEKESFFTDFLGFLFDKNDCWKYIFVVSNNRQEKSRELCKTINNILPCQYINLSENVKMIYEFMIDKIAEQYNVTIKSNVKDELCEYFAQKNAEQQIVENIFNDIYVELDAKTISDKSLSKYIEKSQGVYTNFFDEYERSTGNELQILC